MDNKWIGISKFIPKVWTSLFIFIQGRSTRQNQTLNHCVPIASELSTFSVHNVKELHRITKGPKVMWSEYVY